MRDEKIVSVARRIVEGTVEPQEGMGRIIALGYELGCEDDELILALRGIDSQMDDVGLLRAPNLSKELAKELEEKKRRFADDILAIAKEIVARE